MARARRDHAYYPLVYTSFWIEYQLWGLAPAGYHVNNILIHAASALLLWRILLLLGLPAGWPQPSSRSTR